MRWATEDEVAIDNNLQNDSDTSVKMMCVPASGEVLRDGYRFALVYKDTPDVAYDGANEPVWDVELGCAPSFTCPHCGKIIMEAN